MLCIVLTEANHPLGCLMRESDCQELPSVDEKDGSWKQTLPDAIRDGEVRSTVASVLDGAEDVLSIFFSNGGSALRRVKAKERSRRRHAGTAKASELTPPPPPESGRPEDPAKTAGEAERVKDAFHEGDSPEKKDSGVTQWTPLTFPNISDTSTGSDFSAAPSSFDRGIEWATEELADRQVDVAEPERLTVEGDQKKSSDVMVPVGALAQGDTVLPTNVVNTQGKAVSPLHSAVPHQRAEASKRMRSGDSQPAMVPLKSLLPQSKHRWDPGTMPASSSGNNVYGTGMQSGAVLQPGESPLPGSSSEGCPALTSTRKLPRKFVYSLQSPRIAGQANRMPTAYGHTVSAPTVSFPGKFSFFIYKYFY